MKQNLIQEVVWTEGRIAAVSTCEFEKYSDMKLCGNAFSQHNMAVNSHASDLQGLEFMYDVQRQKTLIKLTKAIVHKMSLYNYDLCSFGLKYSQGIALVLSGGCLQFGFTPCLGIQTSLIYLCLAALLN